MATVYLVAAPYIEAATGDVVGYERYWTSDPLAAAEARSDPTLEVQTIPEPARQALAQINPESLWKTGLPVPAAPEMSARLAAAVASQGRKPIPRRLPPAAWASEPRSEPWR
jgi:hypothetical protein